MDLGLLREVLSWLLRAEWDGASLIVALVVEGTDPAVVAAERGVSRAGLVERPGFALPLAVSPGRGGSAPLHSLFLRLLDASPNPAG